VFAHTHTQLFYGHYIGHHVSWHPSSELQDFFEQS